jgi:hypothetical protein
MTLTNNLNTNDYMVSVSGKARIIIKPGQKKIATHIYRGLHKKLQANNQKSK